MATSGGVADARSGERARGETDFRVYSTDGQIA